MHVHNVASVQMIVYRIQRIPNLLIRFRYRMIPYRKSQMLRSADLVSIRPQLPDFRKVDEYGNARRCQSTCFFPWIDIPQNRCGIFASKKTVWHDPIAVVYRALHIFSPSLLASRLCRTAAENAAAICSASSIQIQAGELRQRDRKQLRFQRTIKLRPCIT